MNFNIKDGENYWNKYDEFIELYNNSNLTILQIRETLKLTSNKYRQYRKKAIKENKIKNGYYRIKRQKRG